MFPSLEIYDGTVTHHNTKPHIYNSAEFNLFCSENEEQLMFLGKNILKIETSLVIM